MSHTSNIYYLLVLVLGLSLTQPCRGIDPDNPWLLEHLFNKESVAKVDPTDRIAVQNMLQWVYRNPNAQLSRADEYWVGLYPELGEKVTYLQDLGSKRKTVRRTDFCRKNLSILTGFSAVGVLAAGIAVTQLSGGGDKPSLTEELNRTYGLKLEDYSKGLTDAEETAHLELLKAMLEASPETRRSRIGENPDATHDIAASRVSGSLELAGYLLTGNQYGQGSEVEMARKLFEERKVLLTTRFGHPSRKPYGSTNIYSASRVFQALKPDVLNRLAPNGITVLRTDRKYAPLGPNEEGRTEATFDAKSGKLDVFTGNDETFSGALLSALAPSLFEQLSPAAKQEWKQVAVKQRLADEKSATDEALADILAKQLTHYVVERGRNGTRDFLVNHFIDERGAK